ncbi:MAG TPA: proton-conducting transporter membrane subunit, partial [Chitinophagaceae bacterium]|nr:proton-conducting transporter membrane subunit [Chitinophagaceae bacterium]
LIGILILSYSGGSLDFTTLIERLTSPESNTIQTAAASSFLGASVFTWAMALVFVGGAGKSAMFPLHIWLPDAMEGPTPISALIHAATMVVAGVYLVARLFPIFAITAPGVLTIVSWVGAFSAIFAAIIACTQTDIKRVLAYSTMSQIGYMMFALGVSKYGGENGLGYTASMFHLFTHALFKALLFLGAGAIIHFVHSNEMKDMGGLRKLLPVTHICFLIACLAIAGIPPFAGFFSKEEILLAASQHNTIIYWIGLITSSITAFYMFRLYFKIFWHQSSENIPQQIKENTHRESFVMMLPLVLLAIGAAFAGFIPFGEFISSDGHPLHAVFHWEFSVLPIVLGLAGIF